MEKKSKYKIEKDVDFLDDGVWWTPQIHKSFLFVTWWSNLCDYRYRDKEKAREQIEKHKKGEPVERTEKTEYID